MQSLIAPRLGKFYKINIFEELEMNTLTLLHHRFFLSLITCIFITKLVLAQIPETGLVSTPDSIASKIATDILEQGGNAINAGVAAMFVLSVVQPYAAGIGGGGLMLIRMNQNSNPIAIDFREQAPQSTDLAIFYQDNETFNMNTKHGYRSIGVPGMMAGAEKALQLYGTMTLSEILDPAIETAKHGFEVSEVLANLIIANYDLIESNRATSSIFLPFWLPINKGQTQVREDLAFTFELLSVHGTKVFYHGEIAQNICEQLKRNNGLVQLTDFQSYQPLVRQPIKGSYRNLDLVAVPPPSSGGIALIELLAILKKFNLKQYKLNNGPYIHIVAEAMKQVFQDREKYYMGDPKFDAIKPQSVLSDKHIEKRYHQIDSARVTPVLNQGMSRSNQESRNAAHISIVDRNGNTISISLTLNNFFGSGVTIPKYGILLNNAMYNFSRDSSKINSLKPGKRPQTSLTPTIMLKNNKPFLILGGSGAEKTISMLAQIIINIVDFQLSLNEAVNAPRFHYNYYDDAIEMETRIEADDIEYLKKLGHKINLKQDYDVYFGSAQAVLIDPDNHIYVAVNDVRQEGVVYIK